MALYGWQLDHVPDSGEERLRNLKRKHLQRALKFAVSKDTQLLASPIDFLRRKGLQSLLQLLVETSPEHAEAVSAVMRDQAEVLMPALTRLLESHQPAQAERAGSARPHENFVSSPTDGVEVALGAAVLQGLCFTFKRDIIAASNTRNLSKILIKQCRGGGEGCHACLDALLAVLASSPEESSSFVLDGGLVDLCDFVGSNGNVQEDYATHALEVVLLAARTFRDRDSSDDASGVHAGHGGTFDQMLSVISEELGEDAVATVLDFARAPDFEARLAWSIAALSAAVSPPSTARS